jgi:hypothetical protein
MEVDQPVCQRHGRPAVASSGRDPGGRVPLRDRPRRGANGIGFESTRIEPLGGPTFRVIGGLTIKDQTREIELETTVEGAERDPWGNDRVGMRAQGTINRKEFGLTWQQALESGGFLLGDEVKILLDISAVRD